MSNTAINNSKSLVQLSLDSKRLGTNTLVKDLLEITSGGDISRSEVASISSGLNNSINSVSTNLNNYQITVQGMSGNLQNQINNLNTSVNNVTGQFATKTLVAGTSGVLQSNINSKVSADILRTEVASVSSGLQFTIDSFKTQVFGTTGNLQTQINTKVSATTLQGVTGVFANKGTANTFVGTQTICDDRSQLIMSRVYDTSVARSFFSWTDTTYDIFGGYYDGGWRTLNSGNNALCLMNWNASTAGMNWYASSDGGSNWNYAANVPLWSAGGVWNGSVASNSITLSGQQVATQANLDIFKTSVTNASGQFATKTLVAGTSGVLQSNIANLTSNLDNFKTSVTNASGNYVIKNGSNQFIGTQSISANNSQLILTSQSIANAVGRTFLAWNDNTYDAFGGWYNGSNWINLNQVNNRLCLLNWNASNGTMNWYSSTVMGSSYDVASNVPLWSAGGVWNGSVASNSITLSGQQVATQTNLDNFKTSVTNASGNYAKLNGGNSFSGVQNTDNKININGAHGTTEVNLSCNNGANEPAYLSLWASEPGVTWDGAGIGFNYRSNGSTFVVPYAYNGSNYIRCVDGNMYFGTAPSGVGMTNNLVLLSNGNSSFTGTLYHNFTDIYWHAGNDGTGSGLDADLLDGMQSSTTNVGNTIVARNVNGDFDARFINSTYFNSSDDTTSGPSLTYLIGKCGDNYHRSIPKTNVKTWLAYTGADIDAPRTDHSKAITTAKELTWRYYGNGHTVLDNSNGALGTGGSGTNPDNPWQASYPTLMGYNGSNTFGVRVDSARYAEYLGGYAASAYGRLAAVNTWTAQQVHYTGSSYPMYCLDNETGSLSVPAGFFNNTQTTSDTQIIIGKNNSNDNAITVGYNNSSNTGKLGIFGSNPTIEFSSASTKIKDNITFKTASLEKNGFDTQTNGDLTFFSNTDGQYLEIGSTANLKLTRIADSSADRVLLIQADGGVTNSNTTIGDLATNSYVQERIIGLNKVYFATDFTTLDSGIFTFSGANGGSKSGGSSQRNPGIIQLGSGTTSNSTGIEYMYGGSISVPFASGGNIVTSTWVGGMSPTPLSGSGRPLRTWFGHGQPGSPTTAFIGFIADSTSLNWQAFKRNGSGTSERADTGVLIKDNEYKKFKVSINSDSNVTYYINDTLVATLSSVQMGWLDTCGVSAGAEKTGSTTTAGYLILDYVQYDYTLDSPRYT